jgi:hypothetical protein
MYAILFLSKLRKEIGMLKRFFKFFQGIGDYLFFLVNRIKKDSSDWTDYDCVEILIRKRGGEAHKSQAWARLLDLQTENAKESSFAAIVSRATIKWKAAAADMILCSKEPSELALQTIIRFGPEIMREKAWEKLVAIAYSSNPFWHLIVYGAKETPRKWREKARELIMKRYQPGLKMQDFEQWLPN